MTKDLRLRITDWKLDPERHGPDLYYGPVECQICGKSLAQHSTYEHDTDQCLQEEDSR